MSWSLKEASKQCLALTRQLLLQHPLCLHLSLLVNPQGHRRNLCMHPSGHKYLADLERSSFQCSVAPACHPYNSSLDAFVFFFFFRLLLFFFSLAADAFSASSFSFCCLSSSCILPTRSAVCRCLRGLGLKRSLTSSFSLPPCAFWCRFLLLHSHTQLTLHHHILLVLACLLLRKCVTQIQLSHALATIVFFISCRRFLRVTFSLFLPLLVLHHQTQLSCRQQHSRVHMLQVCQRTACAWCTDQDDLCLGKTLSPSTPNLFALSITA